MRILCTASESKPPRKGIPSDYQAILTDSRVNFRKAGANYSPLQQNHPNRSIICRSNPLEKATPTQPSHSPASPGKQLKQATNRPETGRKTGGRYVDADRKSYGSAEEHAGYRPSGRPGYPTRTAHE